MAKNDKKEEKTKICKNFHKKAKKIMQQKKFEKIFPPQKNFLETPSICLPLFNPYADMHKFCACVWTNDFST